jgi:hypothetical protein
MGACCSSGATDAAPHVAAANAVVDERNIKTLAAETHCACHHRVRVAAPYVDELKEAMQRLGLGRSRSVSPTTPTSPRAPATPVMSGDGSYFTVKVPSEAAAGAVLAEFNRVGQALRFADGSTPPPAAATPATPRVAAAAAAAAEGEVAAAVSKWAGVMTLGAPSAAAATSRPVEISGRRLSATHCASSAGAGAGQNPRLPQLLGPAEGPP